MLRTQMKRGIGLTVPLLVIAGALGCGDDESAPVEPELAALGYIGSDDCGYCHTATFNEFRKSGHPYKLNKVENGQPPTYPFSEVPNPPQGVSWSDVTYVIGGFGWKARFIGTDGYIITDGGLNQYNLETEGWVDYHKDELKPYDCGPCHTTGYSTVGNQDDLPGIVGTWALPGVQCERCHGPGSLHARSPANVPMSIDTRAELCGSCHNRGGANDVIIAKGGFIRHHEQYNEFQASEMRVLECVTCHDPHTGVRYNDQEAAQAIRLECEECHETARSAIQTAPLASVKGSFECTSCHMPYAAKSAVARDTYVGDVRSHIFKINTDVSAEQFTADGSEANHYLSLEFACLGCHTTEDKTWAAQNAEDIHGAGFTALPSVAAKRP